VFGFCFAILTNSARFFAGMRAGLVTMMLGNTTAIVTGARSRIGS